MSLINLIDTAQALPQAWKSSVLSQLGNAQFKVLRMDEAAYAAEFHSFSEVLLVIDGQLNLMIDAQLITVKMGQAYIVPANKPHSVAQGSFGTLVILDGIEPQLPNNQA